MEIMMGEDMAYLGEFTFCEYVGVAKHVFVYADAGVAVSVPYHLAPVDSAAVDSAAVVKDNSFYFSIFHLSVLG